MSRIEKAHGHLGHVRDSRGGRLFVRGIAIAGLALTVIGAESRATVCIVPDAGGTAQLPPQGPMCTDGYKTPEEIHMIIDGLPPGTTIEVDATHTKFGLFSSGPGGALGGEFEQFNSGLALQMTGTGLLAGFNGFYFVPTQCETHIGPRTPGMPVQSFTNDMFRLNGQIIGDPDFDLLRITAGTVFGMPSPGHTTLTQQGANWAVDSFFDISYRIDFQGAPGSPLAGMSGSTTGTIRMQVGNAAVGPPPWDRWATGANPPGDPNTTSQNFATNPIPADFFGPGSEPFTGLVTLEGEALDPVNMGDTSTLIRRPANPVSPLQPPGAMGTVPIELVSLSLVSVNPITVTYLGGAPPEHWIVRVRQSSTPAPPGSMTATKTHPNGGVFNSVLFVQPLFIFTKVGDPSQIRSLDTGGVLPPIQFNPVNNTPFVHNVNPALDLALDPGAQFVPGVRETIPGNINSQQPEVLNELAPSTRHRVCPPQRTRCIYQVNCLAGDCSLCPLLLGQQCQQFSCAPPLGVCPGNFSSTCGPAPSTCCLEYTLVGCQVPNNEPLCPLDQPCTCTPGTGACCRPDGSCIVGPQTACPAAIGVYQGDGTVCQGVGGCCYDGDGDGLNDACQEVDGICCDELGGVFQGVGSVCGGEGACCFGIAGGGCVKADALCCDDFLGTFQGVGTVCLGDVNMNGLDDVCEPTGGCAPNAAGTACNAVACPPPAIQQCQPKCVNYNPLTGQTTVTDCECVNPNECHVDLAGPVSPVPGIGSVAGTGNPCVVTDNGGGTVTLPPAGCEYLTADEVHMIIDGLPAGTTIELATIHKDFICHKQPGMVSLCSFPPPIPGVDCDDAGGTFGPQGEKECAQSVLDLQLTGTGGLAGYMRSITLPIEFETHTAPRTPGDPVQSFDTDMFRLFGQMTNPGFGDPDFDLLRIVAGTDFGLPSPGHTTLTKLPGGPNWAVDSFFDISYRIDFVGRPGSVLGGMSGSTTGTIRMATGLAPNCIGGCPAGQVCDQSEVVNADGTIKICCDCVAEPTGACCQSNGSCAVVTQTQCNSTGGVYKGDGTLCLGDVDMNGIDDACDCGPSSDGSMCIGSCPTPPGGLCQAKCAVFDPISGQTTVTDCDCVGTAECHVQLPGATAGTGNACVVVGGGGTVQLPPAGCEYLSADEVHMIIDGLPVTVPPTTIELATIHKDFICNKQGTMNPICSFMTPVPPGVECDEPGGTFGGAGEKECAESTLALNLSGTGMLAGFNRSIDLPIGFETHVAPRTPGDPVQSFDTDMFRLFGQITNPGSGDPDFDLLRIVAGTDFGLPSPGHTTLTKLPGGPNWAVDSFFDISYRIDFVGRPGSVLGGMSGSTTGTIRMATGLAPHCVGGCPAGTICNETQVVDPLTGLITVCCDCVSVGCPCVTAADCKDSALCSDDNACNCAACVNNVCVFTCSAFGNTNCMGVVDLDDILCTLSGFGNFASCPSADIHPCLGDGTIDLDDILDVLAAFGGANPCGCNPNGTPPLCSP